MLKIKNLIAGYNDMEILHGIDFDVRPKEIVAIIGPNGAGKTTLAKIIVGDIKDYRPKRCRKINLVKSNF